MYNTVEKLGKMMNNAWVSNPDVGSDCRWKGTKNRSKEGTEGETFQATKAWVGLMFFIASLVKGGPVHYEPHF